MPGPVVGLGIDGNCVQAHFLSGIDDTAGNLSTVCDQQAPDIYGFAHYRLFSLSASCFA